MNFLFFNNFSRQSVNLNLSRCFLENGCNERGSKCPLHQNYGDDDKNQNKNKRELNVYFVSNTYEIMLGLTLPIIRGGRIYPLLRDRP